MLLLALALNARADAPSLLTRVSANGRGVLVLDGGNAEGPVLDRFSDHLYESPSPTAEDTRDLLYDSYFGLAADGAEGWLQASDAYGEVPGTAIIWADRSTAGLTITEYDWAPMGLAGPGIVQLLHVENTGATTVSNVSVFSLHNYQLGRDDDGDGSYINDEAIWEEDGALYEWGNSTGLTMSYVPLVPAESFTCDQIYNAVLAGEDLDGRCGTATDPWTFDDQVGGFQWTLGDLAPGDEAWVGVGSGFSSGWDTTTMPALLGSWAAGRAPKSLLDDEQAAWADWLATGTTPSGLSADEQSVYDQSLVYLKAAQVVEDGAPYGQIVASYPATGPDLDFAHIWNITWVRDSAYAAVALASAGHTDEAEAALAFLLQSGKSGAYSAYLDGLAYGVSVCRTYGDGTEWSDDDGTGPNIELDDFGLTLWAAAAVADARGDSSWVAAHADALWSTADALAALVEPTGDAAGLLSADSSIWERHWDGNQRHFTFSDAWAVRGLHDAANLASALGETDRAETYAAASETIRAAIAADLVSDGVLEGDLEDLAVDGSGAEAFNNGTLDNLGDVALATEDAWDAQLRVASGDGFFRNLDGSTYDSQEWAFVDLRIAEALRRACRTEEATALEDRITSAATVNDGALPEMFDPDDGGYEGPAPMLGFGAGAYVLDLGDRADADADCAAGPEGDTGDTAQDSGDSGALVDTGDSGTASDTGDSAPQDAPYKVTTGCGCASEGIGEGWIGLLVGFVLLMRRLRRFR